MIEHSRKVAAIKTGKQYVHGQAAHLSPDKPSYGRPVKPALKAVDKLDMRLKIGEARKQEIKDI